METASRKPFEDWIVNAWYFPPHILTQTKSNSIWWEFIEQLQF